MKKHRKLQIIFFSLALFLCPKFVFAYSSHVIPGGENIGIQIRTEGIMVVGFYKVDNKYLATEAGFELGDRITQVDQKKVDSIDSMIKAINQSAGDNKVSLSFLRNGKLMTTELSLILDSNNVYKTGMFVKDQINGIGTLTYIDPFSKIYGALGHEITDKNSLTKIELKDGKIFRSEVIDINKSENGKPGEKTAKFFSEDIFGNIKENEKSGIFGTYGTTLPLKDALSVGQPDDVKLGDAVIQTVIEGSKIEQFTIKILKLDKHIETKNILFEITDERLLNATGGVVQGMSGSPIIQNNKIIGAITHVIVNDSKRGYGIFITTMLEEGEK